MTAAATVVVEVLNWWYAPEQGFGLAVRTGWAMLRSFGFLLLIGHVRRGRTVARPFGLILAVTTVFAVGRLIVPRQGVPPLPACSASPCSPRSARQWSGCCTGRRRSPGTWCGTGPDW